VTPIAKLGVRAGLVGPILFAGVFLVEGRLRPGYDPLAQTVSELGIGPRGFIQIANFLVFGIAFTTFAAALRRDFRARGIPSIGPTMLIGIGVLLFLCGVFVADPATTPLSQYSTHGIVHAIVGIPIFVLMPVILVVFAVSIRRDAHWRSLVVPTIVAAVAVVAVLVIAFSKTRPIGEPPYPYGGLLQRAHAFSWFAWTLLAARRLGRSLA
jgi:hypothetical membrane protein